MRVVCANIPLGAGVADVNMPGEVAEAAFFLFAVL